jgi:xylulokinase
VPWKSNKNRLKERNIEEGVLNKVGKKYLAGIDCGTMGVRCVILDLQGSEVSSAYYETPTQYPKPGWVEQKAEDVIELAYQSTRDAIGKSGIKPEDIACVSFTNMRSTFVPIDKDGNFLHPIFVWQDLRGAEMFPWMRERLAANGMTELDLYKITGFPIGAVWPSSKVYWYKKHFPELYEKTYKMITPQALLIKAFGADGYYDDNTDAGWWQICNADTFEYVPKLAKIFEVDIEKYPQNYKPTTKVGEVPAHIAEKTGLKTGTPLIMGSGDQQCGAVGVGNTQEGLASVCLGTAGLCIGYSKVPVRHPHAACHILGHAGTGDWQMEGHASAAASSFRWFRNTFAHIEKAAANMIGIDTYDLLTQQAAQSPPGAKGAIYLPWLAGAACPNYDANARASFVGMTFAHSKGDMIRAAMEGICYEMREMLEALKDANFKPFKLLRVTGGAARSSVWNQIQADIYGSPVETVKVSEATALGAAMLGAVGVGIYKDIHEASANMVHVDKRWEPIEQNVRVYNDTFGIYKNTYRALKEKVFPAIADYQNKG